jgi:glycine dehydrogenase
MPHDFAAFDTILAADRFADRHIGPGTAERDAMLRALGDASIEALIDRRSMAPARFRANPR